MTTTHRSAAQLDAEARQARRIADDLAQQALAARQAEQEARKPKMPDVTEAGTPQVVKFEKYQSGKVYVFAAIGWGIGNSVRWAVTGQETRRFNWNGLLEFIGEANWHTLVHLTGGHSIGPSPAEEPAVAERMGRYGRITGISTLDVDGSGQYGL